MSHSRKFPCRCLTRINGVKCTQRKSLQMRPKEYEPGRQPKCPQCGKRNWYIETYRMKKEMGYQPMCRCSGYHFPHRHKSKYCFDNPQAEANHSERY